MKCFFLLSALVISSFVFSQKENQSYHDMLKTYYKNTVPTIQPAELYKKILKGEKIYILDTREEKEYSISLIKDAIHVGYDHFALKSIKGFKKSQTVIVYCTIGARSETIGYQLKNKGFSSVYNLYGGLIYWKNQGYPVVNQRGMTTENIHVYSEKWGKWLKKGKAIIQ